MKSPFLLSIAVLIFSSLISTVSIAAPGFSNGIEVYESQDGGVYTTTWRAYPMTIEGYTGPNYKKPDDLLIALTADGKTSDFRGVVRISCSSPVSSNIVSDVDYKSLKDAMADGTIPRPVVNGLFAKFCK
ncbi:hypothetical protein [Psychrobacter sp. SZ93C1]|uniref:hypothetical protein n=1 Tax=Psychrobacter sp. SZ93C1 TaxID=2792058 RepID=UPI0018CEB0A6|nr:hypothetical protein [Psychrobacter sp. SZ93C1]MBH0064241.1 hypothetical protein [Psychrobacter sp. SZ93C1]